MKKNITSLFFCLSISSVLAQTTGSKQTTLPNIIPPSSESYRLGSFGNIPVSLFTGNANVDVPLTSYQTKNISLPIKLNYFSNGIRMDDMNGSTGLGWNLTSGGVITRIIRDLPDEENSSDIAFPDNIDNLGANHPAAMQFFKEASHDEIDTEPDLYMASFGSMQIKFVFDKKGVPVIYSQKDVVIEGVSGGASFAITVDDGTKYYFTDKEITSNRTSGVGHSLMSTSTTAWYLTKIEDLSSGEIVFIENTDGGYSRPISISQTMSYTAPGAPMTSSCGNPAFIRYPDLSQYIHHNQTVEGKQIKRIYSNNPIYGEIIFDYQDYQLVSSNDYKRLKRITKKINNTIINDISLGYTFSTGNERLFLDSVADSALNTTYNFEYNLPLEFPSRLSFGRDSWGYSNGVTTNSNMIPKIPKIMAWATYNGAETYVSPDNTQIGMLKKVIYPTKGSSEFFYENHTGVDRNALLSEAVETGVQIKAETNSDDTDVSKTVTFTPMKNEEIRLGGGASFNSAKCEQDEQVPNKHRAVATLTKPNGQDVPLYIKSPTGVVTNVGTSFPFPVYGSAFYAWVQKDVPLTLTLRTIFFCVRSTASASYTFKDAVYGDKEGPIGGLRISKIIDHTENGVATTRKFVYHDLNEQTSEAIVLRTPGFEELLTYTRTCYTNPNPGNNGGSVPTGVERFPYYTITSTNINQSFATHPNIFYKTVQEIIEGKSTIVHSYSTASDNFGKVLNGDNIRNSTWTNLGWNNGREILTRYLDANNNLVRSVEMNYEEDKNRKYQIDGFNIRKNYENPVTLNVTKICTADDITKSLAYSYCTTNHAHHYNSIDLYKNCTASGAQNIVQNYQGICYGKNVGDIVTYGNDIDNLDIVQYKNISHFEYLKSQKTTDYLAGKEVKTETQYFYNNPKHTQLTGQKTIFPDSSFNETVYKYAHEKDNQLLITKNMVGIPLETTATQSIGTTSKMLSKTETIYPTTLPNPSSGNLLLPLSYSSYDTLNNSTASTEVTYNKYDAKGNVLQYTTKEGTPVSIVWGYNQTVPIIKVEGILYSTLESYISGYITHSDADALDPSQEPGLIEAYERLRKNPLVADMLVTTYTYDPLIGVTSITPPSGIREIYVYDTANRLKEVKIREKDSTGNYGYKTVKEFKYNYKP